MLKNPPFDYEGLFEKNVSMINSSSSKCGLYQAKKSAVEAQILRSGVQQNETVTWHQFIQEDVSQVSQEDVFQCFHVFAKDQLVSL